MKNYNESDCLRSLSKKRDCRISGRIIEVSKDNGDVGKKSWAKINYLCKIHGYRYMVTSFTSSVSKKDKKKYNDDYDKSKVTTKKSKLNLKGMVANIMSM